MGSLQDIAVHLVQCGLSTNTRKSYNIAFQKLSEFRLQYGLKQKWPVPVNDLLNFIAFLATQNLSPSTITAYMSGISYFHKINTLKDTTKLFIVSKALEGLKRTKGYNKDQRSPISIQVLTKLVQKSSCFCSSIYEATMFSAAFTLAFFALLRVSEFTKNHSKSGPSSPKQIQLKHVKIVNDKVELIITYSKTQQRGTPTQIVVKANRKQYCPVAALKKYLAIRPICKNGDLFIHMNHSSLTTYQFNQVLKKALTFLDMHNDHIRSHSFRIGGTTYLKNNGVSDQQIMQLGRWKSNAFERYIRH